MHTKTEELLLLLCFAAETILRPSFRSVGESYESWEYRNRRLLRSFRERGWVEPGGKRGRRKFALSPVGRAAAIGNLDPTLHWSHPWDGIWRIVTFDVPAAHKTVRRKLLRWLHHRQFGRLQLSVWIHTRMPEPLPSGWTQGPSDEGFVALLESRSTSRKQDQMLVTNAWDFGAINQGYAHYLDACRRLWFPEWSGSTPTDKRVAVLKAERDSWLEVAERDPFLPRELWPDGYLGHRAWEQHLQFYSPGPESSHDHRVSGDPG